MSNELNTPSQYETILVAEDNDDHIILIKRAFQQARFLNPIQVVGDGAEAIAYLNGDGKYANRTEYPLPRLLLLDLKMPNKNGFEVMEWIRTQPALRYLKIVVLTTTDRVFDVQRAYELGASSFLVKPLDFREFVQLGSSLKGFWIWSSDPNVRHPKPPQTVTPVPIPQAPASTNAPAPVA
jgi:CheY-like chemotaxis protein